MKSSKTGKAIKIKNAEQPLSLEKCKAILNKNGLAYTDEEVLLIREFLYKMAAIVWDDFQAHNKHES